MTVSATGEQVPIMLLSHRDSEMDLAAALAGARNQGHLRSGVQRTFKELRQIPHPAGKGFV